MIKIDFFVITKILLIYFLTRVVYVKLLAVEKSSYTVLFMYNGGLIIIF